MPARFFCPQLPDPTLPDPVFELEPDEARHARKVLRLSEGAVVELFDGSGRSATATLDEVSPKAVRGRVQGLTTCPPPRPQLTVASALPKGPRSAEMINQLAQVGVDRFQPLLTARSVVEPGGDKHQRYDRAALAAAKQSGRPRLMEVGPARPVAEVIGEANDLKLWLDPDGESGAAVDSRISAAERVTLFVGPEGGWEPAERDAALAGGCIPWRIGPHVMRIETAAVSAASLVRYLTLD